MINDISLEDVKMTGMDRIARVISTGDHSPGAAWEPVLLRKELQNRK